jgi:peptidoglycan/LPS O-acetylase OafA/YrhL
MNFQTMSKQRKFVLIAATVGVIATLLPWWNVNIFGFTSSVNGFHGWGVLSFFCFVAAGIIACLDDQTKNLDTTKWAITLIAGAISTLIIAWFIIDAGNSPLGSLGFGAYFAALAAIGVVLSAFLFKSPHDNIRGGFDSLKKDIGNRMGNTGTTGSNTDPGTTDTNRPL